MLNLESFVIKFVLEATTKQDWNVINVISPAYYALVIRNISVWCAQLEKCFLTVNALILVQRGITSGCRLVSNVLIPAKIARVI
jgi:hypothetical protein